MSIAPGSAGQPIDALCMACNDGKCDFKPVKLQRRALKPNDILLDMKFCGICHTDLHMAAGHTAALGMQSYPCVPGHELAGVCSAVGSAVTKVKVGDKVGVGCMVDSCGACGSCRRGEEQKCARQVGTYNHPAAKNTTGRADTYPLGGHTLGGYTTAFVVHEDFAVIIPAAFPLEYAGPVMCAGVTLFDPLRRYGAGPGTSVAVVGMGGLGQMGVKLAKAMGCDRVVAISRGEGKKAFALSCGASDFLASSDAKAMRGASGQFDLILSTIPTEHDYMPYKTLLKPKGSLILLGLHSGLIAGIVADLVTCGSSRVKGSGIGSVEATQAVIDLCALHGIKPDIEVVPVEGINKVYQALDGANDTGKRYVIDIGTLNAGAEERCRAVDPPVFGPPAPAMTGGVICGAICKLLCCCRWC